MSNPEVHELALSSLKQCQCVRPDTDIKPADYPTRLIDLSATKKLGNIDPEKWVYHGGSGLDDLRNTKVKLVRSIEVDWEKVKDCRYVTLSHKWGGNIKHVKLTHETKPAFEEGLRLKTLARTFQDAILFATRLSKVGYIWIDSLCIIQEDENDWLKESGLMRKVYRNSFLNISATAGDNSDEGLYSPRQPHHLWEDLVSLNIDGLPSEHSLSPQSTPDQPQTSQGDLGEKERDSCHAKTRTCLLLDLSTWEILVNQAPVNKRGWVVQERLIAPRVLHFCQGRIAWECSEFDEIEGRAQGIRDYQLSGGEIVTRSSVKSLIPYLNGDKAGIERPRVDKEMQDLHPAPKGHESLDPIPRKDLQEPWARIVEMYSRTDLTKEKDKLIALSGIARQMATVIGSESQPAEYVAGLWEPFLASELLWKIEPVFHGSGSGNGTFSYPAKRPVEYRAPTFSWASVDAQHGNDIAYGGPLGPKDLVLVQVPPNPDNVVRNIDKSVFIDTSSDNPYGLVTGGHLRLWGWIRKVKLQREGVFFSWSLRGRTRPGEKEENGKEDLSVRIDTEQHLNVLMDCPGDVAHIRQA